MRRIQKGLCYVALAVMASGISAVTLSTTGHAVTRGASAATCSSAATKATTATNRSAYARGQTVGVSTSLTNISSRPCAVNIRACVGATITNASGTLVWSAVPLNALCAMFIVHETLRPGQAVTRSWTWDQHVCLLIGQCPGRLVPAGAYTAEGHWGTPYGNATPARFQIT